MAIRNIETSFLYGDSYAIIKTKIPDGLSETEK